MLSAMSSAERRCRRLRLLLLLLLPVAGAVDVSFGCSQGGPHVFCSMRGFMLSYTSAAYGNEMAVVCEPGTAFPCGDFHLASGMAFGFHIMPGLVSSGQLGALWLTAEGCALPRSSLTCALGFRGATAVRMITLKKARGQLEPKHVYGLPELDTLTIEYAQGENETDIPAAALAHLPALTSLAIGGAGRGALPPLPALPALTSLVLVAGRLTSVPGEALSGAPALTVLDLSYNQLKRIEEHALSGLSHLEKLKLHTNRLSSLPSTLLRPCPRLRLAALYDNRLEALPEGLFAGLLHLEEIFISYNKLPLVLPAHAFAGLPALRRLDLQHSKVQNIPEHTFCNSTNLEELYLAKNNLTSLPPNVFRGLAKLKILYLTHNHLDFQQGSIFNDLEKLTDLDLKGNNLKRLPEGLFSGLQNLQILNMAENRIDVLDEAIFSGLTQLSELDLSENRLQLLHYKTFAPLLSLTVLSLAHNNLTISQQVNTERVIAPNRTEQHSTPVDNYEYHSPLRSLKLLKSLDLSGNRVSVLCGDWRQWRHLESLLLVHNSLAELTAEDMGFSSERVTVDLRDNRISRVLPPNNPRANHTTIFLLHHNPFVCDCHLFPFVNMTHDDELERNIVVGDASCAAPSALIDVPVRVLKPDQLICYDDICPDNCSCFFRPARDRVEVNCVELPLIPQRNRTTYLRVEKIPNFINLPSQVKYLDLSGLNLTSVPKIHNSIEIDLRNNKLIDVPIELLKLNCVLHLSNNPIDCSCRNKQNIEYLKLNYHLVRDYRNLTCGPIYLVSGLDVGSMCAVRDSAVLGGVVALSGLMVGLATVVGYRYKTEMRILLRKYGLWLGEKESGDYKYDAFVSFAHQDEHYVVHTLVPKLESGKNALKLCLHYRDWVIGDYIPSQIARSVEDSRRTIIVLSRHFMQSVWAQLEFRVAHGRERLLLLMLDELAEAELDPDMRVYVALNTYVTSADPLVFDRLKDAVLSTARMRCTRESAAGSLALDTRVTNLCAPCATVNNNENSCS